MNEERSQEAEAEKRNRRPARRQADEHEQAAAEFGQDHERQEPGVDAVRPHVVCDAGVFGDGAPTQ